MTLTQNPDGSWTRTPSGDKYRARGTKARLGAQLIYGHSPAMGKHARTLYGPGGFYSKNFAGAREGWRYNWATGMKMNMSSPENPAFHQWVPIEGWEMKRHINMQNYLAQNPGAGADDYARQRWPKRGDAIRDPVTGRVLDRTGKGTGSGDGSGDTGDTAAAAATSSGGSSMAYDPGTLGSLAAGGYVGPARALAGPTGGQASDNYMHAPRGRRAMPTPMGASTLTNPLSGGGMSLGRRRGPGRQGPPGSPYTNPPYMNDPEGYPYAPGPQPGQHYNPEGSAPTFDDYWDQFRRWAGGGR